MSRRPVIPLAEDVCASSIFQVVKHGLAEDKSMTNRTSVIQMIRHAQENKVFQTNCCMRKDNIDMSANTNWFVMSAGRILTKSNSCLAS